MKHVKAFFDRIPISLTTQAILYPIFLAAALIFAQALKMAVSYTVFLFVLLLPLGVVLQLILARLCIRASLRVSEKTVEKHRLVSLCASVMSRCPLPFPFVEAELLLPDERGIRTEPVHIMLSLTPFSDCRIERSVEFAFRGEYTVGLSRLYVCDLSRSVKLRIDLNCTERIFVLPRRFELPPRDRLAEGLHEKPRTAETVGRDITELSDVRLYEAGDSLKRIHWKLSSKSEDIIVKDYCENHGADVCILCDLEPHYAVGRNTDGLRIPISEAADTIDLIGADAVIETALAAALREIHAGSTVTLAWIEKGEVAAVTLYSAADLETVFRRFAAAPLDPSERHIQRIASALGYSHDAAPILVCPHLTPTAAAEYISLFGSMSRAVSPELLLCADDTLFAHDSAADRRLGECVRSLIGAGINVERI